MALPVNGGKHLSWGRDLTLHLYNPTDRVGNAGTRLLGRIIVAGIEAFAVVAPLFRKDQPRLWGLGRSWEEVSTSVWQVLSDIIIQILRRERVIRFNLTLWVVIKVVLMVKTCSMSIILSSVPTNYGPHYWHLYLLIFSDPWYLSLMLQPLLVSILINGLRLQGRVRFMLISGRCIKFALRWDMMIGASCLSSTREHVFQNMRSLAPSSSVLHYQL